MQGLPHITLDQISQHLSQLHSHSEPSKQLHLIQLMMALLLAPV